MKLSLDQIAKELAADFGESLDKNISQKAAKAVIVRVFDYMAASLEEGHEITVPGFAKFRVQSRPERQVRNPSTGAAMTSPAKRVIKVTLAKALKERIGG